ncbi:MAG: hypothetical protein V2B19_23660 [Pseudomonadota bacterium]
MSIQSRRIFSAVRLSVRPWRDKFSALKDSAQAKRWGRAVNVFFTAGILFYLVFRLNAIGWKTLITAVPSAPAFYVLVFGRFFVSPAFQTFIFSILWRHRPHRLFPVFMMKQVFDRDVMDYTGEIYLLVWAKKNLRIPTRQILHILKDNTILSSVASIVLASGWLLVFCCFGPLTVSEDWRNMAARYTPWIIPCLSVVIVLFIKLKKSILFLSAKLLWTTYALHTLRLLVGQALLLAQWATAMPDTPLMKLLTMLAVWIVVIQIPLIPSKELLCIGVGVEISGLLGLPASQTASMLIAAGALNKAINILIVSISLFVRGRKLKVVI